MKAFFGALIVCVLLATVSAAKATDADYIAAVKGLVQRRFPTLSNVFTFEVIKPAEDGHDVFELEDGKDTIIIRGNNGVSLAAGLGHYLKYYAHMQLSWTGDQIAPAQNPATLPHVGKKVRTVSPDKWSYYMNVCTVSYSAAWWNWTRWEREIDWMALQGVNLPLAFTGQEYVLRKLFKEFGLSDEEVHDYFTGPAFLAWFRMGNVQTWAGPLSDYWIDAQHDMQLLILDRMRQFGMTPVLSMFAGHVPPSIKKYYPDAQITEAADWAGFDEKYRTWILEVTDPLFNKLGKRYIEIQTEAYGTDHIYNGDVYNEMQPPTSNTTYLTESSRGTFEGLLLGDPDAIWLMQAWLFINEKSFWQDAQVKAYLDGVPNDRMILLDLFTEYSPVFSREHNYYGKKWIWCMLHNFGGNPGMWGNLTHILRQPQLDRGAGSENTMDGVGITMEAIGQNYVMYEAMLENRWHSEPVEARKWLDDYVKRRYGEKIGKTSEVQNAWVILESVVYCAPTHNVSYIESVPTVRDWSNDDTFYERVDLRKQIVRADSNSVTGTLDDLWKAWKLLLSKNLDQLGAASVDPFNHDVVDLGTNVLTNEFTIRLRDFYTALKAKNVAGLKNAGMQMLELIQDMEKLLATDNYYLLGKWINDARILAGNNKTEADLYEFNARNQLTLWGPDGNINDYACKSWSGLYGDYYLSRYTMWVQDVIDAISSGKDFDQNAYLVKCLAFEKDWQNSKTTYPATGTGKTIEVARSLAEKYGH